MEFIFLALGLLGSDLLAYVIGRSFYDSHRELMEIFKSDPHLLMFQFLMVIFLDLTFFIVLCAFNNTFWHLPYLTA